MTIEQMKTHLTSRHVDLALHRPIINHQDRVATFLLYNLGGQIVGYQQYCPGASKERQNNPKEGRYFTYKSPGQIAVFGLESIKHYHETLYVTEGIFDACRLTEIGCAAIAVLSNNPTHELKTWLNCLPLKTVAVCDNDPAGQKLSKFCQNYVTTIDHDLSDSHQWFVGVLVATYGV